MNKNDYVYSKAVSLANKELKKVCDLLKSTESKWNEYIDLKLHYAYCANVDFELNGATVTFDNENVNRLFETFCEEEFEYFTDWCKENDIDFKKLRDNVGRTSSFYLDTLHNNYKDKYLIAFNEIFDETFDDIYKLEIEEVEGELYLVDIEDDECDYIEDYVNEVLDFVDDIYDEVKRRIDKIEKVYDYIAEFKENQVENFKNFVRDYWTCNL